MQSTAGRHNTSRQVFTLALVFGAMAFGMVLAGGTNLTPLTMAAPAPASSAAASSGVYVADPVAGIGMPNFADLAEAVSPAVVSIQATTIETGRQRQPTDPLEFFFGPRRRGPGEQEQPQERRRDSSGSGFVISADGMIVTNHHVVEDSTSLTVHLGDREYPAKVIGDDPATDLALLKVEAEGPLPYLNLGNSASLRVGSWVMVIGSPLQLENSVSVGVVSAKGRSINITPDRSLENFIQTDAAINFGNSGGPLIDLHGAVVGIATAINFGAENIGFAVPVDTLKQILPQLRTDGAVRRGYLGVQISELDHEQAQAFGLDSPDGVLVNEAVEGQPAAKAGVVHGDIILQVDDVKVKDSRDLIEYVASLKPDTSVNLRIYRDGEIIHKRVDLGERATPGAVSTLRQDEEGGEGAIEWLGLQYQNLNDAIRSNHGIPQSQDGIWITQVAPTSPLYEQQVQPGDLITELNRKPIKGVEDFERMVRAVPSGSYLRLYLKRFDPRSNTSNSFFAIVRVP